MCQDRFRIGDLDKLSEWKLFSCDSIFISGINIQMATADDAVYRAALEASRSIYYSLTDNVLGLTDEEKSKLESVMIKAMEFEAEEENRLRQPLEGQLYKYTNVMKGWQFRWFAVTPDTGMLEYYMPDDKKKSRPRGALYLAGAVVIYSEEDNQSFVISAGSGEMYKLKASDARERQLWVDKVKSVIDRYANTTTPEVVKSDSTHSSFAFCKEPKESQSSTGAQQSAKRALIDPLDGIKESVQQAVESQKNLVKAIEGLPFTGSSVTCSDNNLLLIKAISQASVQSIEQCYLILRKQRKKEDLRSIASLVAPSVESLDKIRSTNGKRESRK